MRVLVTGSRYFNDHALMGEVLSEVYGDSHLLVHGGARGADMAADVAARSLGWQVETYPADWDTYGKAAGHIRNKVMVDTKPDLCLAFPLQGSKGTWNCVQLAVRANVPVLVHGYDWRQNV